MPSAKVVCPSHGFATEVNWLVLSSWNFWVPWLVLKTEFQANFFLYFLGVTDWYSVAFYLKVTSTSASLSARSGCITIIWFRNRESTWCALQIHYCSRGARMQFVSAFLLAFLSWHKEHIPHILQLGMVSLVINTGHFFNPLFCVF